MRRRTMTPAAASFRSPSSASSRRSRRTSTRRRTSRTRPERSGYAARARSTRSHLMATTTTGTRCRFTQHACSSTSRTCRRRFRTCGRALATSRSPNRPSTQHPDQSLAAAIYAQPARANAREADAEGRRIAFVPGSGVGAGGQGELATDTLVLSAQVGPVKHRPSGTTGRRSWPGVVPALAQATVRVPALTDARPGAGDDRRLPRPIPRPRVRPRTANHLEVFARTVGGKLPFAFPADRAAGLVTPSIPGRRVEPSARSTWRRRQARQRHV